MTDSTATKATELHDQLTVGAGFPTLTTDLTGENFTLPAKTGNILYNDVAQLSLVDLTEGAEGGDGSFDKIMTSVKAHLGEEFEENRITGEEYTKAYIELTTASLSTGLQFLLQRDNMYYQNQLVQQQARAAEAQAYQAAASLEETKLRVKLAEIEGLNAKAQNALLKMQLASEDANVDLVAAQQAGVVADTALSAYKLSDMLPEEKRQLTYQIDHVLTSSKALTDSQKSKVDKENLQLDYRLANNLPNENAAITASVSKVNYEVSNILPAEKAILDAREDKVLKEVGIATYQLSDILPEEKANLIKDQDAKTAGIAKVDFETQQLMPVQKTGLERDVSIKDYQISHTLVQQYNLLKEQTEVQHGQTQDTRLDGTTNIVGAIGKQKDLYTQQIDSYKKDARYKVGKMWLDQWITQKSLDEGLFAPDQFSNENFNEVLLNLRADNTLGS